MIVWLFIKGMYIKGISTLVIEWEKGYLWYEFALGLHLESFCIHWSALLMLWRCTLWWNQGWSHAPRCYLECPACNVYIKFFSIFFIIDVWCELELANDINIIAGKNVMQPFGPENITDHRKSNLLSCTIWKGRYTWKVPMRNFSSVIHHFICASISSLEVFSIKLYGQGSIDHVLLVKSSIVLDCYTTTKWPLAKIKSIPATWN